MQPHFACAWAWAGNTPFQWGKQVASHFGGTRDPMVVSWPKRIKDKGGLRSQFTHVIDVAPDHPRSRRHRRAQAGQRDRADADARRELRLHVRRRQRRRSRHTQQYFEIFGNRAMYKDGWIACARLDRIPWKIDPATMAKFAPGQRWDPDKDRWELYNLDEDFSEANDLAAKHPEKLARAARSCSGRRPRSTTSRRCSAGFAPFFGFPPPAAPRTKFTYYPGTENIGAGHDPARSTTARSRSRPTWTFPRPAPRA